MRRRSVSRHAIEIELFPFLSVLACTIGTLVLMIIAISTQAFGDLKEVKLIVKAEDGQNQAKRPRYLECREGGVVIYPSEIFVPVDRIGDPDSALAKLVDEVSEKRDREYFIVAIRPTGIATFGRVRDKIERAGIDIGYEPFDEGWTLKVETES